MLREYRKRISLWGANTMPPESRSNAFTTWLVCSVFVYSKVVPQQCTSVYAHVGISLFSFSTFGTLVHQSPSSNSLPIPLQHQFFFFHQQIFSFFWKKILEKIYIYIYNIRVNWNKNFQNFDIMKLKKKNSVAHPVISYFYIRI